MKGRMYEHSGIYSHHDPIFFYLASGVIWNVQNGFKSDCWIARNLTLWPWLISFVPGQTISFPWTLSLTGSSACSAWYQHCQSLLYNRERNYANSYWRFLGMITCNIDFCNSSRFHCLPFDILWMISGSQNEKHHSLIDMFFLMK